MDLIERYEKALSSIPPPGGNGCHTALLGVANLGVMAGLTDVQIRSDLRNSIPVGNRTVPDSEILDAVRRARMDLVPAENGFGYKSAVTANKSQPVIKPGYLQHLLSKGAGFCEVDFWEASPIRLLETQHSDALVLLETLYMPEDILFIGERYHSGVRPVKEWKQHIERNGMTGIPHIIPNPVTGKQHSDKTGKSSFRCDAAINDFRLAVVEFDTMDRADQLAFWAAIPLPVVALIDSGGKSIHGWIAVDNVSTNEEWRQMIEVELYARRLIPLGVDPVCRTEARLSRLPGHFRKEKGRWQKLLYLNPNPTAAPIMYDASA